jgi:hypothetical protein
MQHLSPSKFETAFEHGAVRAVKNRLDSARFAVKTVPLKGDASEYDNWIRAKIQASRTDPRPALANDEWHRLRTAKQAEREAFQGNKAA